ncbi:MAG: DEAD/DEAH box helicase [Firmicutes bacterium]|nr:DEAD/DEAH box helicase [Bacillota bacterium]
MNLEQILDSLRDSPAFMKNVTHWETVPARPARLASFPEGIDARVQAALRGRGVQSLYTHQRLAVDAVLAGENIVVVTPTASGKTLCYNLPVLNAILRNGDSRALYLFPTKALSADQSNELYTLVEAMGAPIKAYTYDGDTPAAARRSIRQAGHVVVTNPDMLHAAILPGHTKWVKLFENLKFIVIDEIHAYRGVFGSNLANVIRRLKRLAAFYGSTPRFICCSATIANPKELAEQITGEPMTLIDDNGAPTGERHMVFYNPPVVNRQLGIRKSSLLETRALSSLLVRNDVQTIVFARSRLQVEVLARYLKELIKDSLGNAGRVRGYRGGYLPTQRREIERGLRNGDITAVVATNALELGIDIGRLDACVLCGYPGTIASTWQQAGRAGRRRGTSLTLMVASSSALDQYIISHPEYFFKQSPENALANPDNLYILMNHIKCAAYELPFVEGEAFGAGEATEPMLAFLEEKGFLRRTGGQWHWSTEAFPAAEISLRSAGDENFMIIDITDAAHHVIIGEMDRYTVPMLLHEQAIYLHDARQYQVEKLDFEYKKAYIRQVEVDYYTDADLNTTLRVLNADKEDPDALPPRGLGEVLVTSMVTLFKKMKFGTHENLGFGPVDLPEMEMTTSACWWTLPKEAMRGLETDDLQGGMLGIASMLRQLAPLYLMCAPRDLSVLYHVRDTFTRKPTVYFYDNCPGGVGLAEKVYDMLPMLLDHAGEAIKHCACEGGCPSCVGPQAEVGPRGKLTAIRLLERLLS